MKKIMILGASKLQLPAILKANNMGPQTVVVDANKDAVGFNIADTKLYISTIDIPRVVHAAKKLKIDAVMTLASDMPMRTVAAVVKELNITGISEQTAINATNKAVMRECLSKKGIPIPVFFRIKNREEYLHAVKNFSTPFIVKPADNSGSRGIFLIKDIENEAEVNYAFEYSMKNSRAGEIVVEEYMEGFEVSVETLSLEGDIHVLAITDKLTTGAPYFVEMGHSQPTTLTQKIQKEVVEIATSAVKAIGIENGPSHTEIIVTAEGPKIVELGARMGGDNIATHLVPLSTGIDLVGSCIRIALGERVKFKREYNKGSAIRYINTDVGTIRNIKGITEARKTQGVREIFFNKQIGDRVQSINSSLDRVGFVIAQAEDAKNAIKDCQDALSNISIEFES